MKGSCWAIAGDCYDGVAGRRKDGMTEEEDVVVEHWSLTYVAVVGAEGGVKAEAVAGHNRRKKVDRRRSVFDVVTHIGFGDVAVDAFGHARFPGHPFRH